jgi:thiamine biosynthesis protein ThiI
MTTILCRYGELFLKGGNRHVFLQALINNVRAAVRGLPEAKVSAPHGRVVVCVADQARAEACSRLERVFGLVSISPVASPAPDIDAICAAAVAEAQAAVERDPDLRRSFKIEPHRSNKQFPLQSHEIACRAGDAVSAATGIPVDVHQPALRVGIEIATQATHVFAERRPAPGGLPVGVSGRAMLLLSGGIDSPVAGWLAAKRGLAQEALTFHSPPFTGEKAKDKVIALARQLARWQAVSTLWIAGFTDAQKRLRAAGRPELAVVLYRRMMVRVADLLCERARCGAIVTGENLGQVASQTLTNMRNIEVVGQHLILRPLLTYDKVETTALARRIGTYDISALPFEDCCSLFVPAHPATAARLSDVARAEATLDVAKEAANIAEQAERIVL